MEFIDLQAQRRRIGPRLDEAIARVLAHGRFVLGPEVGELEARLAGFCGARHAVACANGTDALQLSLMALEIGPGDAVFVPAFTFAASAEAVVLAGATPVFVDVLDADFSLDAASLEAAVAACRQAGRLRPAAVMPVDLFGQPADYAAVAAVADRHGLVVLADAAQSFGARWLDRDVGTLGRLTATSFFPAKPLGCYGDGGAVFTDDAQLAERLVSLRVHGQGEDKYRNLRVGLNSRLDTLQAAVLLAKLEIFPEEIAARQRVAARYTAGLGNLAATPRLAPGRTSVWAQYTVRLPERDRVAATLRAAGIPTAVYYPVPLNRQPAYRGAPTAPAGVPVAERLASEVLSLPMHPYLDAATQDRIVEAVGRAAG